MMDEEIRQAVSEVREMKQMCGNINMKLTNIVTQRGQDWKKKLEAEYHRGLEDAWNVARKVAVETDDGGVSISALYEMFGTESMCMIMKNNTVYDVTDKLKAYEEKQTDDEIKVGDEVRGINGNEKLIITAIESEYDHCVVMTKRGGYYTANLSSLVKTGRHFDIASILKEMQS